MLRPFTTAAVIALVTAAGGGVLAAPAAGASTTHSSHATLGPGFNAGGTWTVHQSNGLHPTLTLQQDSQGNLTGNATEGTNQGTVTNGFVDGDYISLRVDWTDGRKGRFIGSLRADRRLSGVTTDLTNPTSHATWISDRTF